MTNQFEETQAPPRTPKILIVDDRPENLLAMEKVLASLNIEIIRANSGNEALALTLEQDFALALVDVQMPDMDGFEMVDLLHQQRKTERLPVIFVSAVYSGEYYKLRGVEVGAIDFIEKPIIAEILRGKVRNFLEIYAYHQLQSEINKRMQVDIEKLGADLKKNKELLSEESQKYNLVLESLDNALKDLEETNHLKKMVSLMAGREIRMAELKQEIKRLNGELERIQT